MVLEKKITSPGNKEGSPKLDLDPQSQSTSHHYHHHPPPPSQGALSPRLVVTGAPFISPPIYDNPVNPPPKRPKFYSTGEWKLLPSPNSQQQQHKQQQQQQQQQRNEMMNMMVTTAQLPAAIRPESPSHEHDSSSNTASTNSPIPSHHSAASGQDTNIQASNESEQHQYHLQRRGKYVSPVWKPNEMLWLARAWRVQYQGGGGGGSSSGTDTSPFHPARGKTRAEKDKEVAEFLKTHGIKRDAKTAGTKWDNMLGEFRKVYEWERISSSNFSTDKGNLENPDHQLSGGKSYFRLSPYERKVYRLPASFDEQVFDELSQFMGARMRTSTNRILGGHEDLHGGTSSRSSAFPRTLSLPAPPLRDQFDHIARAKQVATPSGGGDQLPMYQYISTNTTFDSMTKLLEQQHQLHRIGKIRMIWEESVTLWGDHNNTDTTNNQVGRVKIQGSSFLNADELTFFDESMVACSLEAFDDGPLKGFSVDKFQSGQQVKVFGRRSSSTGPSTSGFPERFHVPLTESSIRSNPPAELQDPTEYYVGCLKLPPTTLPTLFELSWVLQEPPPVELRFPLRRDVYRDLPQGKELFFTTTSEPLDCRALCYDLLSVILRPNPTVAAVTSRDSLISLWDDCINRIVSKFCSTEMVLIRKPSLSTTLDDNSSLQDQWPNVTGFVRNLCLWRGEEVDQLRDDNDPSSSIVEKLLWTYGDLPYILGYYAIGYTVTFCALSRSAQDRTIIRTDLYTLDLSVQTERLKALIPCWRIAGLLQLLADQAFNHNNLSTFSDFERGDIGSDDIVEITPNTTTKFFSSKQKWSGVKEIYDFLDHRIPHSEQIVKYSETSLSLTFKPRGQKTKPKNSLELINALKCVTKALVALHDLSFMHRDLSWEKVTKTISHGNENDESSSGEWIVTGYEEAVTAPQIYKPSPAESGSGERHAPEMGRGIMHGVKVDVWGVGELVRTSGLVTVMLPKILRELMSKCLDLNPEVRPTAADCYHHLLQLSDGGCGGSSCGGGGGTESGGGGY